MDMESNSGFNIWIEEPKACGCRYGHLSNICNKHSSMLASFVLYDSIRTCFIMFKTIQHSQILVIT